MKQILPLALHLVKFEAIKSDHEIKHCQMIDTVNKLKFMTRGTNY